MWRLLAVFLLALAFMLFGFSLIDTASGTNVNASAVLEAPALSTEGYARALETYEWNFPRDFGAHPEFQTEWWYYTGNLFTDSGERFGFQFTIFRRAISPQNVTSDSEWRTNQIYMAHFTVSDISGGRFYHEERYSRGGAGLAGATTDPRYRVWLDDWEILAEDEAAERVSIRASGEDFSIDLRLVQLKAPALQGDGGLSPKSAEPGNASYYYTLSRLETSGTVRVGERDFVVSGLSWKDHEFSTSALGGEAQGWDWFGLIFDDGSEMMIGQIRLTDGGREPAFGGMFIAPDGSTLYLPSETFTITALDTWTSPHTGAVYPSGWRVVIDHPELARTFEIIPAMQDQELHGAGIEYWEGAVDVRGDLNGFGYAELTGYIGTMQNRF